MAARKPGAETPMPLPEPCDYCRADGGFWVVVKRVIGGETYTFAGRCDCPRGRYLHAKDVENESRSSAA